MKKQKKEQPTRKQYYFYLEVEKHDLTLDETNNLVNGLRITAGQMFPGKYVGITYQGKLIRPAESWEVD